MKTIEERYLFLQSQYYKLLGLALDRCTTTIEVIGHHQRFIDYEASCTNEPIDNTNKVQEETTFKVGDMVRHLELGKGTVVQFEPHPFYPYQIDFEHGGLSWCSVSGIRRIENE